MPPSMHPQIVSKDRAWYYESRRGVELITRIMDGNGQFISGDVTRILWSQLMRSAKRCGWMVRRSARKSAKRTRATKRSSK